MKDNNAKISIITNKGLLMYRQILLVFLVAISVNGCTMITTAPIEIAGAVVGATIDVASAAGRAVVGSDDKEEEKKEKQ